MSFNPRMSTSRGAPNYGHTSTNHRSKQQEEADSFMMLSDSEIATCISEIGFPFTVADLQKPNPQHIQRVFEMFAELVMNTTREVVAPATQAAAEDMCGDNADRIFTADTRDLMGFFVVMRRMLAECRITDFTFQDVYKPTRERLVKIFSYTINFIRFRESHTAVIDEHYNRAQKTKLRIEQLHHENTDLANTLEELERNKRNTDALLAAKEKRNAELKTRLLELKRGQERVSERLERERAIQARAKADLEDRTRRALETRAEADKLRPYASQSPGALESQLRDLGAQLANERGNLEYTDRRTRALQGSADAFSVAAGDVSGCIKVLSEVQGELSREEEESSRAGRRRDALGERSNNVRDVERQERLLQKQLANVQARTDKLRQASDEKTEKGKQRVDELRGIHRKMTEERAEKHREIEKRRMRIEQTEKKVSVPFSYH
jgi:kinetochore protein Nuf2